MRDISHERGDAFEDHVAETLSDRQWTIVDRNVTVDGFEIDVIADAPITSLRWFIECKGGVARQNGLARADTVKRTVGTAWGLRQSTAIRSGVYFVVTTTMPSLGSPAHRLITDAVDEGLIAGAGTLDSLIALHEITMGTLPHGGIVRRMTMNEW